MFFPTIQEIVAIHQRSIEEANLVVCAATYAYHLTKAHAFLDGNKRVAAAVSEIFLEMNGASLTATNDQLVDFFLGIASGIISREVVERQFSEWIVFHQFQERL